MTNTIFCVMQGKNYFLMFLIAVILCGCSNPPSCTDASALALVKQIIFESLQKTASEMNQGPALYAKIKDGLEVSLEAIRTSNKDEKIAKVSCDAFLLVKVKNPNQFFGENDLKKLVNSGFAYKAIEVRSDGFKSDVHYSAQNTEDTKNLLVELSGHSAITSLLVKAGEIGAFDLKLPLGSIPPDLLNSTHPFEVTWKLFDQIYGRRDPKTKCWLTKVEDQSYCMRIDQNSFVRTTEGPRLYAIAAGEAIDENGAPNGAHVTAGLTGAFIVGEVNGVSSILAQSSKLVFGTNGNSPKNWEIELLGTDNNWGWRGKYSDCHQGYCGTRTLILGKQDQRIVEIANIVTTYDDKGHCGDVECEKSATTLEARLKFSGAQPLNDFFTMAVSVNGIYRGDSLQVKTWALPFEKQTYRYKEPKNWILSNLDF